MGIKGTWLTRVGVKHRSGLACNFTRLWAVPGERLLFVDIECLL